MRSLYQTVAVGLLGLSLIGCAPRPLIPKETQKTMKRVLMNPLYDGKPVFEYQREFHDPEDFGDEETMERRRQLYLEAVEAMRSGKLREVHYNFEDDNGRRPNE